MPHEFRVRFFTPSQEAIFQKCLQKIPKAANIVVQPLKRVGFSGAQVFVFFPHGDNSFPFVGKIHTRASVKEEADGRARASKYFSEANLQSFTAYHAPLAIIATHLIPNDKFGIKAEVTELRDVLFAKGNGSANYSEADICKIIDVLYSRNCGRTFENIRTARRELGSEYQRYLRKSASKRLLQSWMGKYSGDRQIEIYGRRVPNPLIAVEKIKVIERDLPISTIHGDLHPSNVVLDSRRDPHLIDFTWCDDGAHILKDFLVMECSIRFLGAPKHLGREGQKIVDTALLDPNSIHVDKMVSGLKKIGIDADTISHFKRCAKLVMRLRAQAKKACKHNFDPSDYLACQALVLFGLMRYSNYPFGACARALGLISERLYKTGYLR